MENRPGSITKAPALLKDRIILEKAIIKAPALSTDTFALDEAMVGAPAPSGNWTSVGVEEPKFGLFALMGRKLDSLFRRKKKGR